MKRCCFFAAPACAHGMRPNWQPKTATCIALTFWEGFEGNKDAAGHRKTVEGWCHAGLPWTGA